MADANQHVDYILIEAPRVAEAAEKHSHTNITLQNILTKLGGDLDKDVIVEAAHKRQGTVKDLHIELAQQWLHGIDDMETRSYLCDKLIPTLVIGLEKLSLEVERKNLHMKNNALTGTMSKVEGFHAVPGKNEPFNPMHYLGTQFLLSPSPSS